jgi:hypothetical protein
MTLPTPLIDYIVIVLVIGICVFVFIRYGLLTLIATVFFSVILSTFPITTQLSVWYAGIGITGLVLCLAMAIYAFHTSLGGQPLFGRASLED